MQHVSVDFDTLACVIAEVGLAQLMKNSWKIWRTRTLDHWGSVERMEKSGWKLMNITSSKIECYSRRSTALTTPLSSNTRRNSSCKTRTPTTWFMEYRVLSGSRSPRKYFPHFFPQLYKSSNMFSTKSTQCSCSHGHIEWLLHENKPLWEIIAGAPQSRRNDVECWSHFQEVPGSNQQSNLSHYMIIML